ncbi:MAG TPA: SDR family NAD(P)-dependent oxidoreductase [Vicinamibacterales bacterium]|nr:SDR family NAD(P)-dependent oxidoreductase [Vicinamibacterales bacterium]
MAIVTGATQGLGRVVAEILANRGYALVVGARTADTLAAVATELQAGAARVTAIAGDVADPDVRARLIGAARELGGLHLLVNNASALGPIRPLMEFDVRQFEQLVAVNVTAPLALMQLASPLIAASGGLIVNVTSDAAVGAYPGWGPYGSTKAALELLSRTFGAELADQGVSTVVVDPGDMRTAMHQAAFPGEDISDRPLPAITTAFWNWLFDQPPDAVRGQRFGAQTRDARWLQPAS